MLAGAVVTITLLLFVDHAFHAGNRDDERWSEGRTLTLDTLRDHRRHLLGTRRPGRKGGKD